MCGAWLCDSRIFSFGIEWLIISLLVGFGAIVRTLICRIWGDTEVKRLSSAKWRLSIHRT